MAAQICADLVGERDLERVEAVVDVLGHLGDRDRDTEAGARQAVVQPDNDGAAARVALADHRLGRLEEVVHAGALAKELGVEADPEVDTHTLTRHPLQDRDEDVLARAGHHRAAVDDDVPAWFLGERGADLLGGPLEVLGGQTAAGPGGGADADEGHVRLAHGRRGIVAHLQPAVGDDLGDQLTDPILHDGRCAVSDEGGLLGAGVDAEDLVAARGEARGRHAPDVSESEDAQADHVVGYAAQSTHSRLFADSHDIVSRIGGTE